MEVGCGGNGWRRTRSCRVSAAQEAATGNRQRATHGVPQTRNRSAGNATDSFRHTRQPALETRLPIGCLASAGLSSLGSSSLSLPTCPDYYIVTRTGSLFILKIPNPIESAANPITHHFALNGETLGNGEMVSGSLSGFAKIAEMLEFWRNSQSYIGKVRLGMETNAKVMINIQQSG